MEGGRSTEERGEAPHGHDMGAPSAPLEADAGWRTLPNADFDGLVAQIIVSPRGTCGALATDGVRVRRRGDGSTLLHVVAGWKKAEQVVRDLLAAGLPPNIRDDAGWTPLLEAAQEGRIAACQALLEAGATADLACGDVTPLHAAIEVGNEEMARWLMQQPGTWDRRYDNAFFAFLLEKAPGAIPDYLDAFAAVLNHSRKGLVAVKYSDLRFIYGEPGVQVSDTALALAAESASAHTILSHRLMRHLLHVKWHSFGRAMFRRELAAYSTLLISYFVPTVWADPNWTDLESEMDVFVAGSRAVSWLLSLYLTVKVERNECRGEGVRQYFKSFWNWMSLLTYVAILCSIPLELTASRPKARNSLLALVVVCLWVNLLQFLQMSKGTGLLIAMMSHMVKDIYRFVLLYAVFLLGFSGAFYLLLRGTSGYENFTNSFITVYLILYGQLTYDNFRDATGWTWHMSNLLLMVHLVSAVVVLLNILLAMMATTYSQVWDSAEAEALQSHAQTIVRMEKSLSARVRRAKFQQLLHAPAKLDGKPPVGSEHEQAVNMEEEGDVLQARLSARQNVMLGVAERLRRLSFTQKLGIRTHDSTNKPARVVPVIEPVISTLQEALPSLQVALPSMLEPSLFSTAQVGEDVMDLNEAVGKPVLGPLQDGVRYEVPATENASNAEQQEQERHRQKQAEHARQQQRQIAELKDQVQQLTMAVSALHDSVLKSRGPRLPQLTKL